MYASDVWMTNAITFDLHPKYVNIGVAVAPGYNLRSLALQSEAVYPPLRPPG